MQVHWLVFVHMNGFYGKIYIEVFREYVDVSKETTTYSNYNDTIGLVYNP